MALQLGDEAPDFTAESTEGTIKFHDYLGDSWGVLFSHPKDFTPVCTTELGYMAKIKPEFDKRNVKILGLSVDPLERHKGWADDIEETQGTAPNYPLIADSDFNVAKLYDMLPASTSGDPTQRTPADNMTVRNVFVIGPDKKIKLILVYPMSTGRNFDEVLRVIDSLQLTANYSVSTPVNWKQGDDVIIAPADLGRGREGEVPEGMEGGQAVPPADAPARQVSGSVAEVVPARVAEVEPVARAFRVEVREVLVRDVFAVHADGAATFGEVEAGRVVDRFARPRRRPSRRRPSRTPRRSSSETCCGGASSISPAACAASASSGPNHWIASVSAPSAIAVPPATGPTKNHVAKRFGEMSGVVQLEKWTSASGSTSTPASSFASRAAARRAAASTSAGSSA